MTTYLTKYEPLIIIECYDGTEYLVPESKRQKLEALMESSKFVKINEEITEATLSIKRIKKAKYEVSLLEQMIADFPDYVKSKNYKKEYKKYKRMYKVQSEMREHFESLFHAGTWELRFRLLQIEHLYNVLDEVETMTNDPLAKAVIKNAKERHQLDKLIHARKLFE